MADEFLLEVRDLKKYYPVKKGLLRRTVAQLRAVDGANLSICKGETVGLVGESGCGKTTLGRTILRTHRPTEGEILFRKTDGAVVDLAQLEGDALRAVRPQIQMIFQDPQSSLNPRMTVLDIVSEPLVANRLARGDELVERVKFLMGKVGLEVKHLNRYPHAFSGGQRQRIGIARALITNPSLVVADEAVSALDVSVRAQVLNLLSDLQRDFGLTYLFISHDLSVIQHISNRVVVMYVGRIVEVAPTDSLFARPLHPYTEALLLSIPAPDPRRRSTEVFLSGETPSPVKPPSGCYFHPRCKYATDKCKVEAPPLRELEPGRQVACHYAETLELRGVALHS
ncbi:MAG: ATP-binding cassette domain-containing protein [Chloroflexi bacterium]|nr:ATP-binding cassette domain-containing protein [Chloroflexota bacterium]